MSMLQRFAFHREPGKEAQLAKQVTVLQGTLARCKQLAMRWRRLRVALIGTIAVIILGLGFVLGIYQQPIRHSVARLIFKPTQSNADAGYAAYQKGDYATALRILRPLAEEGDARAQFNVGVMYSEGQGAPQDYAEAGNWYRLSAEHGYAQAQYNLGLWYARAEGGSQDDVRAHMWFNLAAAHFPPSDILSRGAAIKNRDTVASRMTTEQIAEAQRLAREWQPKP
jgi:uncharacterized protein